MANGEDSASVSETSIESAGPRSSAHPETKGKSWSRFVAVAVVAVMVVSTIAVFSVDISDRTLTPEEDQTVDTEVGGTARNVVFEVSHIGESYLKPTDYSKLGRSDHSMPGVNQWYAARNAYYNDTIVHNSWPYVVAVNHYSSMLASQAKYRYLTSSWTTHMFFQLKVDAENISGLATGAQKDPWIVPIFHTGTDPDADDGGWVNMSLYQNYLTDQEFADIKAGTHYANTFYGVPAAEYASIWRYFPNDGYFSEIQGHWDFSRRAAHKFLGLPGTGSLITEYNAVGNVAIATSWENQWIADGDVGGPLDTYTAYDYSLLTGNGPVSIWVKLDAMNSTADKIALWFWSHTWGAEFLFERYLDVVGIERNFMQEREDWYLNGTFSPLNGDIHERMTTMYHMTAWSDKQSYNNPTWMLEPQHIDYTAERLTDIYISLFDPYYWTYYADSYRPTRMCYTPGVSAYGQRIHYWNTPMTWILTADQTLKIKLPSASQNGWGIEPYWSNNYSLPGLAVAEMLSNGVTGEFVLGHGYPSTLYSTTYYNPATKTITIPGGSTWPLNPNPAYPTIAESGSPLFYLDISPVSHYGMSIVEPGPYMTGQAYTLRVTPLNLTSMPVGCNQTVQLPAVAGVTYGASSHTFLWSESSWSTTVTFDGSYSNYTLTSQDAYFYLDIVDSLTVYVGGTPVNRPPTVDIASSFTVVKRVTNTYNAVASDSDNDTLKFTWDWGDRKTSVTYTNSAAHAYAKKGTYTLTLSVDDQTGLPGHIVYDSAIVIVVDSLPPPTQTVGLGFAGLPFNVSVNSTLDFLLQALDMNGAVSTSYVGTVGFWSTDSEALIPGQYTFTLVDAGQHWFYGQLAFMTPGIQTLSAQDIVDPTISGNATVNAVDSRVILLDEHFDSWSSLEKHWTVWNCSDPLYNSIDVSNGTLRMTNLAVYPVNDAFNAMANWTYPMTCDLNLTVSFRIYLPLNDYSKQGTYGQFIGVGLYDSSDVQRLFARFLMDTPGSVPNGFVYINQYSAWSKISGFNAGWHNVSISLMKGASTWVASFDGAVYGGLTYTGSVWNASDLSKIVIFNALREEPVTAMIDDFRVERVGPPAPPPQNTPPVAEFVVAPSIGNPNTNFYFNASFSHDKEDALSALKFRWDWQGDGIWDTAWSSSPYQVHAYHAAGTFRIVLQVIDTGALTAMTDHTVFVDPNPPFCFAGPDKVAYNEHYVDLSAEGSFDAETSIVEYWWSYTDWYGSHVAYGKDVSVLMYYPAQQSVPVTLHVTDAGGNTASDVCMLTVWPYRVNVLKYGGQDSKVFTSYRLVAPDNGDWNIFIENQGLRSVAVRVLEIQDLNMSFIYEGTVKFQTYGAYPNGTVYLPTLQMKRGYEYQVDVVPSGSAGKYADFGNMFVSRNQAPVAQMSIAQSGMTVSLDATASFDPDGDSMRFVWSFGDGTKQAHGSIVNHTYSLASSYIVTLQVYDSAGMISATSQNVTVPPVVNLPPVPVITVVSISGLTVNVDGGNSYDPDGSITWYSWTWWDGTPPTPPSQVPTASHTYATAGTYTIRLQVWDDMFLDATVFKSVTVGSTPPEGNWSVPVAVDSGTALRVGYSSVDANFDGDATAVWTEQNGGQWNVWANRYVVGSGWQGAELIGTSTAYTYNICVGYDDTYGNVTVAWIRDSSIITMRYISSGLGWQGPTVVSGTQSSPSQLTMGVGGQMAVLSWKAWDGSAYRVFAAVRGWDGVWSAPAALVSPGSSVDSPSAAIPESGGNAAVAFTASSGVYRDLYVSSYDYQSGLWGAAVLAENLTGYAYSPNAAMDTFGNIFVVWLHQLPTSANETIYGNMFREGLGWGVETRLEPTVGRCSYPQISTYGSRNAVVSWSLSGPSNQTGFTPFEIRSCRYLSDTGWTTPVTISSNIMNAWRTSLDVDWVGNAFIAWAQADGTGNPSGYHIMTSTCTSSAVWSTPVRIAWATNTSGPVIAAAEMSRACLVWSEYGGNEAVWASTYVDESALPLIASFTWTLSGSTLNVDATRSSPASRIVSYTWNWGDGTMPDVLTTPFASHAYGVPRGRIPAPPPGNGTPPPMPLPVFGYTYDSNGSPLFGCSVTVTNLRTGEYLTTMSDMDYGYFSVDVGYLSWMSGDPIEVTAISGGMFGSSWAILDNAIPYLWLDTTLHLPGQVLLKLTVTDTLGEKSVAAEYVNLA